MKKFLAVFSLMVVGLLVVATASYAHDTGPAHDHDDQKIVVVGIDEVIDKDYFATGDSVFVSGTVNGDVYSAGGKVVVDGTVNGDVLSVGGNVEVPGTINGDVRVAGGQISVDGQVDGSLTALGGNVVIGESARIAKSIVVGAGSLTSRGEVFRGANIGAGDATISGLIGGDVRAGTSNLTLGDGATIGGNIEYWSENELTMIGSATVAGSTTRHTPVSTDNKSEGAAGFWMFWAVISAISGFLLGILLIRIAPNFTNDVVKTFKTKPFVSMGIGLLAIILTPILFIILLVTLIGIPFALMLLFAMIVLWMFVKVFVAFYIGGLIQDKMKWKKSSVWSLVIGLIVWVFIANIPVIGHMIAFVASLAVVGAFIITKKNYIQKLTSKKLI